MTLSPLTDMAYINFIARMVQNLYKISETTQNFEYQVTKSLFDNNFSGEKKIKSSIKQN